MSRTYRRTNYSNSGHRSLSTTNERRQLKGLLADIQKDYPEFTWGKVNRMHRYIPTSWDDIVISACYEWSPKKPY